eukprot:357464-Chlamydomonas_euryale.AAC.1
MIGSRAFSACSGTGKRQRPASGAPGDAPTNHMRLVRIGYLLIACRLAAVLIHVRQLNDARRNAAPSSRERSPLTEVPLKCVPVSPAQLSPHGAVRRDAPVPQRAWDSQAKGINRNAMGPDVSISAHGGGMQRPR